MKDWAEECAERWRNEYLVNPHEGPKVVIEGAIREALEKAAWTAVAHCSCSECRTDYCKPYEAIRALGAK